MQQLIPEKNARSIFIILVFFASIGPIAIDIFTPSLPAITNYFATNNTIALWSATIFMLGFSISMLICGPLADSFGRKKTLLVGYILFFLATILAINTDNIYVFITARFFQAVFGCFGTAIARIFVRDYYNDHLQIKMLAYIGGCLSVAPMIAPIAGGYIQDYLGWKYNFIVMATLAIIAIQALLFLPERHKPKKNQMITTIFSGYISVLSDKRYLRYAIAAGAAFSGAFAFIAGGPFVFIIQLKMEAKDYGMLFPVIVSGYIISASFAPYLFKNFNRHRILIFSGILLIVGSLISLITGYLSQGTSIVGYISGLVIYELGLGIYMPVCQACATEHMKVYIGLASGLIFFIEMVIVTIISSTVDLIPGGGTTSLAIVTLSAVILSILCFMNNKNTKNDPPFKAQIN